jgi:hypothetical protein
MDEQSKKPKRKLMEEFESNMIKAYTEIINSYLSGKYDSSNFMVEVRPDVTMAELQRLSFDVQSKLSHVSNALGKIRKVNSFFSSKLKNLTILYAGKQRISINTEDGQDSVDENGAIIYMKFKNKEEREAWIFSQDDVQQTFKIVSTSEAIEKELSALYNSIDKQLITIWTMTKIWTEGPDL